MFMDAKEKSEFFAGKSNEYQEKLSVVNPRVSKTKKIVKFAKRFEVKPFKEVEKVGKIGNTDSFFDSYHPEHFS